MGEKMLMMVLGLSLILLLPAGQVKAEEPHSHEHDMEAMHSSVEHGHEHGEEYAMGTEMGQEEAVYTCPMHPEVREKQPGKCTICGMFLGRVESTDEGAGSLEDKAAESGESRKIGLAEKTHSEKEGHEHQHG